MIEFQPTRPLRGATRVDAGSRAACRISTHAPFAGRDHAAIPGAKITENFNPRAPCGARLLPTAALVMVIIGFQPTRPLRGATIAARRHHVRDAVISTHAPLAGRDGRCSSDPPQTGISTHAPLAGRDPVRFLAASTIPDFNPRAPCGARLYRRRRIKTHLNFNPRAPCGARPQHSRDPNTQ